MIVPPRLVGGDVDSAWLVTREDLLQLIRMLKGSHRAFHNDAVRRIYARYLIGARFLVTLHLSRLVCQRLVIPSCQLLDGCDMTLYTAYLQPHELDDLTALLRQEVYLIDAPTIGVHVNLDIYEAHYLAFSLRSTHEFIVISSAWKETPRDYIDYWQLGVTRSTVPRDMPYDPIKKGFVGPTSSFELTPASLIISIEVFRETEQLEEDEDEIVSLDCAIVIEHANGRRYAIGPKRSIVDVVELTFAPSVIDDWLRDAKRIYQWR